MGIGPADEASLTRSQCLRVLRAASVGRLGLSVAALQVIVPVFFTLDGNRVVFSARFPTKLATAVDGNVVCFEIDGVDLTSGTMWTVAVTGKAYVIARSDDSPMGGLATQPPPEPTRQWFVIECELVTGHTVAEEYVLGVADRESRQEGLTTTP